MEADIEQRIHFLNTAIYLLLKKKKSEYGKSRVKDDYIDGWMLKFNDELRLLHRLQLYGLTEEDSEKGSWAEAMSRGGQGR